MRICLVCTEKLPLPPIRGGAIQAYIDGILPYLSHRHEITVVGRRDLRLPIEEQTEFARYVRVPAGRSPAEYFAGVARFLAAEPFDVVEVFNRPLYLPNLAEVTGKARLVLSVHNDMFNYDRIPAALARWVLERVSAVVAISDYVRERIDTLHPGFSGKLRTIRSGVDTERFLPVWAARARRQNLRRRLGLLGKPVILHVSRLSLKKGNHVVLQAMPAVLERYPGARLLMVGSRWYGSNDEDSYTLSLRLLALGLGDAVRFTGFVPPDRIQDLFLAGDLFVNGSQWQEPLARVHYEAMAAGLPIITTDRGGNAEVIEPDGNGLIAQPHNDPAAFADQICRLLGNRSLRERMGRRGRLLALERYRFERVAGELLEVLETCGSW